MFIGTYTFNFIKNGYDFSLYFSGIYNNSDLKSFFIATLIGFALGALFFFYMQWADALKREQQLTREKLIFQYETLKSQVNPHFLFNSLNTLSSLVRENTDFLKNSFKNFHTFTGIFWRMKKTNSCRFMRKLNLYATIFFFKKLETRKKFR